MPTESILNDLPRRVVDHDKKVAEGLADPASPPYNLDELRAAVQAISLARETLAQTPARKRATTKVVDLSDLIAD